MEAVETPLVRRWLVKSPSVMFVPYTCLAAFTAYCCMYAMRKPFTAASYTGLEWYGIQFKIVLVVSQVLGYATSKFIGIRIISSMQPGKRGVWMLGLLGIALLSLLGFALTPFPYNAFWLFVNGLPLGMIWGIVFGYLEGRRTTEVLAAALSVNFIISSGFVKSVGQWLLTNQGIPEFWMPFVAGLIFVPPLLVSVWLLEQIPPPSQADQLQRNTRTPMSATERRALWKRYAPGFVLLIGVYLVLTIIRDVRDNFAVEIWSELGFSGQSSILTTAELPVAALTLLGLGALILVKNNFKAFRLNHLLTLIGSLLLAGSTFLFQQQWLSPIAWMVLSGFALFVPYIIFNGILFDRLLATYREPGNVGFLMYVADAIGYLGSVLVLLWRNFGFKGMSWLNFYTDLCYIGATLFGGLMVLSWVYFSTKRYE
jgi:Family of unknown function (DUF5690)